MATRRIGQTLRAGFSARGLAAALAILAVLPAVGGALLTRHGKPVGSETPLSCPVIRGEFLHEVTVQGEIESADSVEVWCDVNIAGFYSTTILELVPEGTHVQPGDFLARFDSTALEAMRDEEQTHSFKHEWLLALAEEKHQLALSNQLQYIDGTYQQQKQNLESQHVVAAEEYRQAEEYARQSRELFDAGYITQHELDAGEFSCRKARLELDMAATKLDVLDGYTRPKMEELLASNVLTTQATLEAAQFQHERTLERLAELNTAIENCVSTSPASGCVVYAHLHHHGHSHIIKEGGGLRPNQVFVRLPDPKRMRIKATVHEDQVALVEKEMPVSVRLESLPDVELTGRVERVNEYSEPIGHFGSSVKEFEMLIALDDYDVELYTGMSVEATIRVEHSLDQRLVPAQTVLEHGDKHYCLTCDAGRWQAHEVEIGNSDGNYIVIRDGLEEGTRVVLGTRTYRDRVDLPKIDP